MLAQGLRAIGILPNPRPGLACSAINNDDQCLAWEEGAVRSMRVSYTQR